MSTKINQDQTGGISPGLSSLRLSSYISYQSYLTSLDPSKTRTVPQEGMTCNENKSLVDFGHKGTNNQLALHTFTYHYVQQCATDIKRTNKPHMLVLFRFKLVGALFNGSSWHSERFTILLSIVMPCRYHRNLACVYGRGFDFY